MAHIFFIVPAIFIYLLTDAIESARILGVFPIPSISHQVVFRALTQELARRGHELVIITPNPALPKERPADNITEIDVGFSYEILQELVNESQANMKRGIISDASTMNRDAYIAIVQLVMLEFGHSDVQKLIEDKNQNFDLILAEAFVNYPLIFSKIFNAPVIQFSSFYGIPENYEAIGAVSMHPNLYPHVIRNKFRNLSLWDAINEIYIEIKLRYDYKFMEQEENNLIQKQFGTEFPNVAELRNNVEMLFVNSHPTFDGNRPVPPNVVFLGALHLLPVKKLPQDLEDYLNNSTRGVVYVSLGTNVRPSNMDQDMLDTFIDTFEALPFDILWKFDGDNLERVPKNVKIQKWFPQRDLLTHPKVKAFVTQGGLQSTDEAIDAGVPLVGIPMLGDQWYNVNKYVQFGIGVELDAMTITKEEFVKSVLNVIENKSYKTNIDQLRIVINDQPHRPLERAVWWTEHVIRHRGARHLRSPAANITWTDYLMLNVLIPVTLFIVIVLTLLCVLSFYVIIFILKFWKVSLNEKVKVS